MGEGIKDGDGGRAGLGPAFLVPGGDVAPAERRQRADGHRSAPECQPRDDGRAAPGGDQGKDGRELDADVRGADFDGGFCREPPQCVVAGGAWRPGHPRPAGQVAQAAGPGRPVLRYDKDIGIERQLAQPETRLRVRRARGVILGEHDVQVTQAQIGKGGGPVAFGDGGLNCRARGGKVAQGGSDKRCHDALEGRHSHRPRRLAGQSCQVALCLAELGGDALAVGREQPPGRGQPDLPA